MSIFKNQLIKYFLITILIISLLISIFIFENVELQNFNSMHFYSFHLILLSILIIYLIFTLKKIDNYILKQRELQSKLSIDENRYRGLFNNAGSGVIVYAPIDNGENFIFVDLNKSAENIFKIDKRKIIGNSILKVLPKMRDVGLIDTFKKVYKNEESNFFQVFKYKDDNLEGWFKNYIYKLSTNEIVTIFYDITEKKEYEDKLLLFKTVIDNSSDTILIMDNETKKIINTNDTAPKMLGFSKDELFNLSLLDIDMKFKNFEDLNECVKENEIFYGNSYIYFETKFKKKNGTLIPVEVGLNKIKLDEKVYLINIARDITERKFKEKELKEKEELIIAQSRQAAMGDMIAIIAHQWRQPISTISMASNNIHLDIALNNLNKNEIQRALIEIDEQTRYLSKTIDDFRNFFKPNKEKITKEIAIIINEVLNIIGKSLSNNNISLLLDIGFNEKITTYTSELIQVLLNIINNARDVIRDREIKNGTITISVKSNNKDIYIYVCDNANGVPNELIGKIFEPYFTTKNKTGTGLGLYISKVIIEKHLKGTIKLENRDKGACFIILLPKSLK